jgi:hypothetical protein
MAEFPRVSVTVTFQMPRASVGFESVTVNVPPLETEAGDTVNCCGCGANDGAVAVSTPE